MGYVVVTHWYIQLPRGSQLSQKRQHCEDCSNIVGVERYCTLSAGAAASIVGTFWVKGITNRALPNGVKLHMRNPASAWTPGGSVWLEAVEDNLGGAEGAFNHNHTESLSLFTLNPFVSSHHVDSLALARGTISGILHLLYSMLLGQVA